jgi:hypothetical protein
VKVCDAEGKVNTVRYEAVNAMLLNEFVKEHRRTQEQERELERFTPRLVFRRRISGPRSTAVTV